MYNKVTILPYVIPAKAGIQRKVTGFRVKHGMTVEENYKTIKGGNIVLWL